LCTSGWLAPSRGAVCPPCPDHVVAPEGESPNRPVRHSWLARTSGPARFFKATPQAHKRVGEEAV